MANVSNHDSPLCFASFTVQGQKILMPLSQAGWKTIYFAELPSRTGHYTLIVIYGDFDKSEFLSAFHISTVISPKPTIIVFAQTQRQQVQKTLEELNLRLYWRATSIPNWLEELDITSEILKNLIVNFEASSLLKTTNINTLSFLSHRRNDEMDEVERNILSAWSEPIKKRILLFTILAEDGIGIDELGKKVSTRYDINGTVAELVGLDILSDSDGLIAVLEKTSNILSGIVQEEFCGTLPQISRKLEKMLELSNNNYVFVERVKTGVEALIGEKSTIARRKPDGFVDHALFKDTRVVVIEPPVDDINDASTPSRARDFAESQFNEGARFICLLVSPYFGSNLVKYTADWLKRRVALVDAVALLSLECATEGKRFVLDADKKRKILDIFVNNNAGALWEINKGIKILK